MFSHRTELPQYKKYPSKAQTPAKKPRNELDILVIGVTITQQLSNSATQQLSNSATQQLRRKVCQRPRNRAAFSFRQQHNRFFPCFADSKSKEHCISHYTLSISAPRASDSFFSRQVLLCYIYKYISKYITKAVQKLKFADSFFRFFIQGASKNSVRFLEVSLHIFIGVQYEKMYACVNRLDRCAAFCRSDVLLQGCNRACKLGKILHIE